MLCVTALSRIRVTRRTPNGAKGHGGVSVRVQADINRKRLDTRGHEKRPVRDREARVQIPGPPPIRVFKSAISEVL